MGGAALQVQCSSGRWVGLPCRSNAAVADGWGCPAGPMQQWLMGGAALQVQCYDNVLLTMM